MLEEGLRRRLAEATPRARSEPRPAVPRVPEARPRPPRLQLSPRPGDGGAGRGWLVAAVEKQRDEVTPNRGRRERLKEAENETRRATVGRKPES